VRARGYGGGPTWHARRDVVRVLALRLKPVPSSSLQIEFSPNFATKVHKPLNTKVAHQTTLYNFAKSSRVF
jgi:hypothetical protein